MSKNMINGGQPSQNTLGKDTAPNSENKMNGHQMTDTRKATGKKEENNKTEIGSIGI